MSSVKHIDRVARVCAALDTYWTTHGCPPTLRELTEQMGLRAYSAIYSDLLVATAEGRIKVAHNHAPGLTPYYMPLWVEQAIATAARHQQEYREDAAWLASTIP
jgi:hypothetical protein